MSCSWVRTASRTAGVSVRISMRSRAGVKHDGIRLPGFLRSSTTQRRQAP